MSNLYADMVEQIILEMKETLPQKEELSVTHEYFLWLDFLKKIKPESSLLTSSPEETKEYEDIREIMLLAETNHYPVWYIQPHFSESTIGITYENGELKKVDSHSDLDLTHVWSLPRHIPGFSGIVKGVLNTEQHFIAFDLSLPMNFVAKMELLKNRGFMPCDHVLFPTDKIMSISSSALEASLIHFISQSLEEGLKVEGVRIISDAPFLSGNSMHIIFKPKSLN